MKIEITEQEFKDIKLIRNYFGVNDSSCHEHLLFKVADNLVKKLNLACVSNNEVVVCQDEIHECAVSTSGFCTLCQKPYLKAN